MPGARCLWGWHCPARHSWQWGRHWGEQVSGCLAVLLSAASCELVGREASLHLDAASPVCRCCLTDVSLWPLPTQVLDFSLGEQISGCLNLAFPRGSDTVPGLAFSVQTLHESVGRSVHVPKQQVATAMLPTCAAAPEGCSHLTASQSHQQLGRVRQWQGAVPRGAGEGRDLPGSRMCCSVFRRSALVVVELLCCSLEME